VQQQAQEEKTVRVIAVETGPAGISTPSVVGVKIYLKSPSTGATLDSHTTSTDGVGFNVNLSQQFYVTTATSGALGGDYGFYQELNGGGVPVFTINGSGLCSMASGECSSYLVLILYRIHGQTNVTQATPTFAMKLRHGWNLVSVPYSEGCFKSTTCPSGVKAYAYDRASGGYVNWTGRIYGQSPNCNMAQGAAYWIKTSADCEIVYEGKGAAFDFAGPQRALPNSWYALGAPLATTTWESVRGNCEARNGPWKFDAMNQQWVKATSLNPTEGFFVKVKSECDLGTSASSSPPPLPD
jgi:hypothetical protein